MATRFDGTINAGILKLLSLLIMVLMGWTILNHMQIMFKTRLQHIVVLWSLYITLNIIATKDICGENLINLVFISFFWVFSFFYGVLLGSKYDLNHLRKLFIIILPFLFYFVVKATLYDVNTFSISDTREQTNVIFYIMALIPFFMTYKNKDGKLIILLCLAPIVLFALKRSAIIIFSLILILYLLDYSKGRNYYKKVAVLIICAISLFAVSDNLTSISCR